MRHRITCATKDRDGDVQTIGNPSRTWSRLEAVRLIDDKIDESYVQQPGTDPVEIRVYRDVYLRTTSRPARGSG